MTNPISALLDAATAKLERAERKVFEAERERDLLRAQRSALLEAARAVDAATGERSSDAPRAVKPTMAVKTGKIAAPLEAWNRVFQTLCQRHPNGFGYDEIAAVADDLNVPYKRDSLRTKMMNYVNSQNIERLDSGRFQITEAGVSFFSINPQTPQKTGVQALGYERGLIDFD